MMLQVAFTTLLLSASTMVFGSPAVLTGRDNISAAEASYCLLRTYVADTCVGEERNGFLWGGEISGCKPCGDIKGEFNALSFQGSCPGGYMTLFNESGCNPADALTVFEIQDNDPPANETCYGFAREVRELRGLAKSIQMCFHSH